MRTAATTAKPDLAGLGAFFRPRDMDRVGLSFADLHGLIATGKVKRIGRGLYRQADAEPDPFETIALVSASVEGSILCLLSALVLHGIGTQSPHEVWIAINRKARKPANLPARVRIVRFSGPMLTYGIQTRPILGVPVRVTSPARTVVDCFRYRNKLGLDVAWEALREAVRSRRATVSEITRAAEVCHARTVLRPYLEVLSL